jgi:hypothetical protein
MGIRFGDVWIVYIHPIEVTGLRVLKENKDLSEENPTEAYTLVGK